MELVELPRREKFFVGGAVVALKAENLAQIHPVDWIDGLIFTAFSQMRRADSKSSASIATHNPYMERYAGFCGQICSAFLEMLARSRCTIAIQHLDCTIEQSVRFVGAALLSVS
jgi:hypothetical protein